jgi:hypothetical protein
MPNLPACLPARLCSAVKEDDGQAEQALKRAAQEYRKDHPRDQA